MLSDYPNTQAPEPTPPKEDGPKARGLRPPIQEHLIRWITSQGLSSTAAEALTLSFYDRVLAKAKKEGARKVGITYDVGFEHEYIKISFHESRDLDPEELLGKYLFEHDIKGEWRVASSKKSAGQVIYTCKPDAKTKLKKGRADAALKAVDKLSPKQAQLMLEALQAMMNKT